MQTAVYFQNSLRNVKCACALSRKTDENMDGLTQLGISYISGDLW